MRLGRRLASANVATHPIKTPGFRQLSSFLPPRGTHDVLGREALVRRAIEGAARSVVERYGCEEVRTPVIDSRSVFTRSLGEATDVVSKEMFGIVDRARKRGMATDNGKSSSSSSSSSSQNDTELVLRPEGTAAVARAVLANKTRAAGLAQIGGASKLWYSGPFFRRERPQKGRYRQFDQFGVEMIGCGSVLDDIEAIVMAANVLDKLQVLPNVELRINSLGDSVSRERFRDALREHLHSLNFSGKLSLSAESQRRLESGGDSVLRILDSKHPDDVAALALDGGCPSLEEFLSEEASERMQQVLQGLKGCLPGDDLQVIQDNRLVRGLDYYCHTAFEFVVNNEALGTQQGTVLAGGRYDGLLGSLGYKQHDIPGIGWAAGLDRLKLVMQEGERGSGRANPVIERALAAPFVVSVLPLAESGAKVFTSRTSSETLEASSLLRGLDIASLQVHTIHSPGKLKKKIRAADSKGSSVCVIIGDDEIDRGVYAVRDMKARSQVEVSREGLAQAVSDIYKSTHSV